MKTLWTYYTMVALTNFWYYLLCLILCINEKIAALLIDRGLNDSTYYDITFIAPRSLLEDYKTKDHSSRSYIIQIKQKIRKTMPVNRSEFFIINIFYL